MGVEGLEGIIRFEKHNCLGSRFYIQKAGCMGPRTQQNRRVTPKNDSTPLLS